MKIQSFQSASALVLIAACQLSAQAVPASSTDFFETRIRPLLANNCYSCHTDSELGGLRLDSQERVLKGGKRGPAVVPGDPDKSVLIAAVKQVDPALKMPVGGKLKESEVADLVAWINAGAAWPKSAAPVTAKADGKYVIPPERRNFWSFQPLKDVPAPPSRDPKWARSVIDRFVLARLDKEGLKPVRPASKHDLLRRATLDLIGIPPTQEEYAEFDKDTSTDAFAKVVDRLLASPHYGERWGRVWLDVARYGEDDYRSLNPFPRGYYPYANAHLYRDWVIQAFNDDLPYDTFVKAQLAGDLMDESVRHKMLPATGFLGLGPWFFDNGAVEVTRADERHDRVDAVTRGFLGMTVACARCHDHKYDPIPQTDYYSLAGVFASTSYHEYPQLPKAAVAQYERLKDEHEKKQKQLNDFQNELSTRLGEALALEASNYLQGVWEVTGAEKKKEAAEVVEARKLDYELFDRWVAYMGKTTDKYKQKEAWQAMIAKPGSTAEQAKKLADAFQAEMERVMIRKKDTDEENEIITAKSYPTTKKKKLANKPNEFITNDDFCPGCGLELKRMPEDEANFWTEIFQRDLSESADFQVMGGGGKGPKPGVLLFRGWGLEKRVGAEERAALEARKKDVDELKKKLDPAPPFIHGVMDNETPTDIPISVRGNPYNLGPTPVPRHFMSIHSESDPTPFKKGSGRMELADAITKSPIAMRVIVNRIWKEHFGTGIVDTPSNFGFGGERPTNPELLEYLASDFQRNGMSIKKLHREIMLTSTYQLGTDMDDANYAKDSGNRFYWRANRKRMEAEELRDSVLSAAGNLDLAVGGPSVELTPALTRRTVYGKVSRYKLDTFLQTFDFPSPNISAEKRFTTTVPLQRLFLMNSDFMQLESEELAKRAADQPDNKARIRKIYSLIFGRDPNEQETALGLEFLRTEPLRQYEELKAAEEKKKSDARSKEKDAAPSTTVAANNGIAADVKAPPANILATSAADSDIGDPDAGLGKKMMSGVGKDPAAAPEVKYEASVWGRYVKALLGSSEFLFIN